MPRNTMTYLREYNEQYFSKVYKTVVDDRKIGVKLHSTFERYTIYIAINDGKMILSYYQYDGKEKHEELRVSVSDATDKYCYMVRYFDKDNGLIAWYLETIKDILMQLPYSGDDIRLLVEELIEKLPWM